MGLVVADRVKETTTTTGTGTINLAGAVTQFQSFISAVGTGNLCNYCILGGNGTDWETGIGTVTSGTPNTLSRTTVLASSNSGSLVSLTGTSTVFLTEPAAAMGSRFAIPCVPPQVAGNWTQQGFSGTATLTNVSNGLLLEDTTIITSGDRFNIATLAAPSTPYTIDAQMSIYGSTAPGTNAHGGIGWTDGTKLQAFDFTFNSSSPFQQRTNVFHASNSTTFVANDATTNAFWTPNLFFGRINDNGTNVTFSTSPDGVTYYQVFTVAKSSGYLGSSGYSKVCIWMEPAGGSSNNPAAGALGLMSWWQH